MTSLEHVLMETRKHLASAGSETAALEARILLSAVTQLSQTDLITQHKRPVTPAEHAQLTHYVQKRLQGMSIARILGAREFWGMTLVVSPATLEPRPDTETLVETALKSFDGKSSPETVLDIGTGCGAIALALARIWKTTRFILTDLSEDALRTAMINADRQKSLSRMRFLCTSFLEGLCGPVDVIVSNPPYIARQDIPFLSDTVKKYDPVMALDGGEDGYDAYRQIIPRLRRMLSPGGFVFLEVGYCQAETVMQMLRRANVSDVRFVRDLSGIPRVVQGRF